MYPVVIFYGNSHGGNATVTVAGAHSLTEGAQDAHLIRQGQQTVATLTDAGRDEYLSKVHEIAKYGVVEING